MSYSNEEILNEADILAEEMKAIEEVERFRELEAKLNENKKIQTLINQMKAKQKQAVNFQAYGKSEALRKAEKEIDDLQHTIDSIPIVQEFKDTQVVINDLLQTVSGSIEKEAWKEA